MLSIIELRDKQKEYFKLGSTLSYDFRIMQLKKLKFMMIRYEKDFIDALQKDLQKSEFESIASELQVVLEEINFFLKHLKKWMKVKKVKRNMITLDAQTSIAQKPFGVSLILSPWNYPVQLAIMPLIGAIGAGNTAIIAPSHFTPNTYSVLQKSIKETFNEEYIAVVDKSIAPEEVTKIEYDKIFFTGSPRVGRIVMKLASEYLTSVTLELGGKSPVIIDDELNLKKALKRLLWGKFMNSGQTCVSPDYLLVKESIKDEFIKEFKVQIELYLKERKLNRIVNETHYKRLKNYLNDGNILFGGEYDDDNISLAITLIEPKSLDVSVMQEEIFGPIFPIITYKNKEEAIDIIEKICPNPLAMYVFSSNKDFYSYFTDRVYFGGCCINDTISHILNPNAPFGGVANSGIGQYHGYSSFQCFSKDTTILNKGYGFEFNTRYPPYDKHIKFLRKLYNGLKK